MDMKRKMSYRDYFDFYIYKRYNYYFNDKFFKVKGNLLLAMVYVAIAVVGYLIYSLLV